jgi:hypothetical protein
MRKINLTSAGSLRGIGFVAFFVWMTAMGVSLLRHERSAASKTASPLSA